MTRPPLEQLFQKIDLEFKDSRLITEVFTHRSYLNESEPDFGAHNERLEFLGDAVLELVVTDYLFRNFQNTEGELTNWRSSLVRGEILGKVANELGLGQYLLMSRGEEKSGGRTRNQTLANTLEALIGAIYLEFGYQQAESFIRKNIITLLPDIIEKKLYIDAKSRFQEMSQELMSQTPDYLIIAENGPDHDKQFTVAVRVANKIIAEGTGPSKQKAEQSAAAAAIAKWESEATDHSTN